MPGTQGLQSYRVRRWSALAPAKSAGAWADRADNMRRMAAVIERRLLDMCPVFDPRVTVGRVGDEPQLMFELTLRGENEMVVLGKADYRIGRALMVTFTPRRGSRRSATLSLPMGKVEVEEVA